MKPIELNIETFVENVEKDGIFIIDFWASWCAPCKAFAPVFEAVAEKYPDITWGKVDTDAQVELATELGIRSIPTLMVFRDGVLLLSQPGALPGDVLDEIVEKTRTIDMAEVRRQIAEAESAAE
jgi:thioredoxin 1